MSNSNTPTNPTNAEPLFSDNFTVNHITIEYSLYSYRLSTKFPFGTAHSTTKHRNNALFQLTIGGSTTYGEAGLPPKRKHVYCADIQDCHLFVQSWSTTFKELLLVPLAKVTVEKLLATVAVPLRCALQEDTTEWSRVVKCALLAIQQCDIAKEGKSFATAGQAMIEVAVISAVAQRLNVPTYTLLGINGADSSRPTFYTASLNDDIAITLESASFGKEITPHLKIKLNNNPEQTQNILATLHESENKNEKDDERPAVKWCVDANCAWTPTLAIEMLAILKPYVHKIMMVEQPFPVETTLANGGTTQNVLNEWINVKKQFNAAGFPIFADESMRVATDISRLVPLVNGVNIKMEKCGGYINALKVADEAKKAGLDIWIGCMVGSTLNGNGAAQLVGMDGVVGSDLDGSALVTTECQAWLQGGFEFLDGGITVAKDGIGLNLKCIV